MATTKELTQFRTRLYSSLPGRGDALMDLLDALAGNQSARSVVELSLSPAFRRCWSSVSRAIARFNGSSSDRKAGGERIKRERRLVRATQSLLETPQRRGHWLFGLDATPLSRPHAPCLSDRGWVHQCDGPSIGAPVTIGHQYSLVVGFPEADDPAEPAWVLPLSSRRVPSARTANEVGSLQIRALLDDPQLPWYEQPVVVMGDSAYGCLPFLGPPGDFENLVLLTRVRSNRVFHPPPEPGSRRWYGSRFSLRDRRTWTEPAETCRFWRETPASKRIEHQVERFADLRMRGSREQPMHRRPFDLLRVTRYDEHGQRLLSPAMWLILMGRRRDEISSDAAVKDYLQRFDQEHFHRFCCQRLLLDAFQTPVTEHEESWITLVTLAYAQLFAARCLAEIQRNPWEPQLNREPGTPLSPTQVQRDFPRLLRELGTPARSPKPRNLSLGRLEGQSPGRRQRHPVKRKAKSRPARARAPGTRAA